MAGSSCDLVDLAARASHVVSESVEIQNLVPLRKKDGAWEPKVSDIHPTVHTWTKIRLVKVDGSTTKKQQHPPTRARHVVSSCVHPPSDSNRRLQI